MNTSPIWLLQWQEVLKVVTISIQTFPFMANYCLSNVDQTVHLYRFFGTAGIFWINVWLCGPSEASVYVEGAGEGRGGAASLDHHHAAAPTAQLWSLASLIDEWAAVLSSTHQRPPPTWRARFHCATLCSKFPSQQMAQVQNSLNAHKETPDPRALSPSQWICSQGFYESLNNSSVMDTFMSFLRKATFMTKVS